MVICAKTAEPVKMPFGLWARIAQGIVLDGDPQMLGDVAMATRFWLFMGYNFGCMTASDMLFDSRVGFWGQAIRRRHRRDRMSKGRCHGN